MDGEQPGERLSGAGFDNDEPTVPWDGYPGDTSEIDLTLLVVSQVLGQQSSSSRLQMEISL